MIVSLLSTCDCDARENGIYVQHDGRMNSPHIITRGKHDHDKFLGHEVHRPEDSFAGCGVVGTAVLLLAIASYGSEGLPHTISAPTSTYLLPLVIFSDARNGEIGIALPERAVHIR